MADLEPVIRKELIMQQIAKGKLPDIEPHTREEAFLYAIAQYIKNIYAKTQKVTMTSEDTAPALETGKKYIFPDMASLAYTLTPPADETESAIYWFIFGSPADAATTVTHPEGVTVDGPTIAAGKRYEVSISDGLAIVKEWEAATA